MSDQPARRLEVSEDQALYFRACRSHLAGPGASSAAAAARAVVGIQAQQLEPALFALSQRTASRPTSTELQEALYGASTASGLVRTWGQRDTVHIYDAAYHWRRIIAARPLWPASARQGPMPEGQILADAVAAMQALGRPLTRKDLLDVVEGKDYTASVADVAAGARQTPEHFAAGRLLWKLAYVGAVYAHQKVGSQQTYGLRIGRFEDLEWPPTVAPESVIHGLVRDYLAVYGPATPKDISHHFGGRVTGAKAWCKDLRQAGELIDVECGDRKGLLALAKDADALSETPPKGKAWPVRLLPKFDTMLMGHADKSWTVPIEADRKLIWRKAAQVLATVLVRGKLVAVWTHKKRTKDVVMTVTPLSGWRAAYKSGVEREAQAFADHLGVGKAEVKWD